MTRFLTATAMAMVATAALAAQSEPPVPPAAPGVGKVMVRSEVQAMVRTHFARMDTNKDGAITTEEVTAMRGMHMGEARSSMAGEHLRTGDHGMRDPAAAFDRLDANKDGSISRDEFAKGREMRIEKRIVMHGGEGMENMEGMEHLDADAPPGAKREIHIKRIGDGKMGGHMGGGRMIVMADANHDGRITLAEAEAMALQHFDQMDANKDGQVTPEERRAGRPMMMKMRMAPKAG